jgi:cAMP phosphodiesterase
MKFQLLPSTFEENGTASPRQHLACFVIDDSVAIDAGSLAMATSTVQKRQLRDVVLTHAHLDHVAGLPLFIDDLFASLTAPICVHALPEIVETLERDIFNWDIYPRFSELNNINGAVMKYLPFETGEEFSVKHLRFKAVAVNHKVSTVGFVVSDGVTKFALSSDTAEMDRFWQIVNNEEKLSALLIECAFPDELEELARVSHHLTPKVLRRELGKFNQKECATYVINIKPMYRDEVVRQINALEIENLQILEVGQVYEW